MKCVETYHDVLRHTNHFLRPLHPLRAEQQARPRTRRGQSSRHAPTPVEGGAGCRESLVLPLARTAPRSCSTSCAVSRPPPSRAAQPRRVTESPAPAPVEGGAAAPARARPRRGRRSLAESPAPAPVEGGAAAPAPLAWPSPYRGLRSPTCAGRARTRRDSRATHPRPPAPAFASVEGGAAAPAPAPVEGGDLLRTKRCTASAGA